MQPSPGHNSSASASNTTEMASTTLKTLTNELFECVVEHLDLEDIRSLRLVSKEIAFKTNQERFKSFFRTKHVDITKEDLQVFVNRMYGSSSMACLLEHLTLVGVVWETSYLEQVKYTRMIESTPNHHGIGTRRDCTKEELAQVTSDLDIQRRRKLQAEEMHKHGLDEAMLTRAFRSIAKHNKSGGLKSLSLEIRSYCTDSKSWISAGKPPYLLGHRDLVHTTSRLFHATIKSLQTSGLQVQDLDLFHEEPSPDRGGLPCNNINNQLNNQVHPGLRLDTLESLSLSIADPVKEKDNPSTSHEFITRFEYQIWDPYQPNALVQMLQACSNLKSLRLRWWNFMGHSRFIGGRQAYINDILRAKYPFKLQRLQFKSLECEREDLLGFFQTNGSEIDKFILEYVWLQDGRFGEFFEHLGSDQWKVSSTCVKDLFDQWQTVRYEGCKRRE